MQDKGMLLTVFQKRMHLAWNEELLLHGLAQFSSNCSIQTPGSAQHPITRAHKLTASQTCTTLLEVAVWGVMPAVCSKSGTQDLRNRILTEAKQDRSRAPARRDERAQMDTLLNSPEKYSYSSFYTDAGAPVCRPASGGQQPVPEAIALKQRPYSGKRLRCALVWGPRNCLEHQGTELVPLPTPHRPPENSAAVPQDRDRESSRLGTFTAAWWRLNFSTGSVDFNDQTLESPGDGPPCRANCNF